MFELWVHGAHLVFRGQGRVQGEQLVSAKECSSFGSWRNEEGCLNCGSMEPTWYSGDREGYRVNSLFRQRIGPCLGLGGMRKDV
jgi:hypothetical protein